MSSRVLLRVVLVTLLLSGYVVPPVGAATPARTPSGAELVATPTVLADENIRVVVFRSLIEKGKESGFDVRGPFCLAVGAGDEGRPTDLHDPRPGVLERLQGLGVTVRALSRCRAGDALIYTAGIQWRRADEARVNAASLGWVGKETDATRLWFTVRLDPKGWTVTDERVQPAD